MEIFPLIFVLTLARMWMGEIFTELYGRNLYEIVRNHYGTFYPEYQLRRSKQFASTDEVRL